MSVVEQKVVKLEELAQITERLKGEGKTVAHCHGVFDLLHPGHIKHFEAARKFGDVLVVTLTEDAHVNKGPDRPVFNELLRAEVIAAMHVVDYVAINFAPTAVPAIEAVKPSFYVKGQDYKKAADDISGGIIIERDCVEQFGGKLVFTEEIQFSSSKLINRHISTQGEETERYLNSMRSKFKYDDILARFEDISKYKVLIVGDIILDEYQFVNPLGKSSKSATITAKKLNTELYAGGVLAVANHIADFVSEVTLVASYGLNDGRDYLPFIKENLHPNINFKPLFTPDRPTTLKRRMVDKVFKTKMFEVIEMDDSPLEGEGRKKLDALLADAETNYDLMVVADFGHGLLTRGIVDDICAKDVYLCVNSQTNSANKGYNLLTKYPRCNYFSIDKGEAKLAVHDRFESIERIQPRLMESTQADLCAITLGVEGSAVLTRGADEPAIAPILNNDVVDTIGAGDAYLSVTSLLARQGASPEEIALIGNAVGAMAVKILGNKSFIEKTPLLKYIKVLLS